jgi:hypothetical protein
VNTLTRWLSGAVRKVASVVSSLLPGPPSAESPPPDIDGRRPSDTDTTKIDVDIQRKEGKGGFR